MKLRTPKARGTALREFYYKELAKIQVIHQVNNEVWCGSNAATILVHSVETGDFIKYVRLPYVESCTKTTDELSIYSIKATNSHVYCGANDGALYVFDALV
eukprot:TRINITY_DN2180_c0_g1_i2.p1 TRINITY_DN2180_c0_g1~~TRINITY_DN2180_c0_g1_i2.p1  ORF type:complete len:101 (-),score=41.57 TRINITY_DN2180_c0_g1_i2:35-337(-)